MHELHEIDDAEAAFAEAAAARRGAAGAERPLPRAVLRREGRSSSSSTTQQFGATAADRERKLFQGGLTIETTLDPKWQQEADTALHGILTDPHRSRRARSSRSTPRRPREGVRRRSTSSTPIRRTGSPPSASSTSRTSRNAARRPPAEPGQHLQALRARDRARAGRPAEPPVRRSAPDAHPDPAVNPPWDLHNFDDKKNYGRIDLIEATVELREHGLRPAGDGHRSGQRRRPPPARWGSTTRR